MEEKNVDINEMEAVENLQSRPRRKPDASLRGHMHVWREEGLYEFASNKERPEMKREVMHNHGGVKLAKTQGEKESSYILTVKVSGDSEDPYGHLMERVATELKGKAKKEVQIPNANFLVNQEGKLQVWKRRKENKICAFITLDASVDRSIMMADLLEKVAKINQVISKEKK